MHLCCVQASDFKIRRNHEKFFLINRRSVIGGLLVSFREHKKNKGKINFQGENKWAVPKTRKRKTRKRKKIANIHGNGKKFRKVGRI